MKRKIFTLLACASFLVAGAAELTIKTMTAPVMDADPSDWGDTWIDFGLVNAASTTSDMSGKFQMGYDMTNLYLVIEINDATVNTDATLIPNSYERDCNETFISMLGDTMKKYHEGCWQLRKQRVPDADKEGVDGNNGKTGGGDLWNTDTLQHAATFHAISSGSTNPYYIEWSLPWKLLTWQLGTDTTAAWNTTSFNFDIALADNTTGAGNGRTQQVYWNNNTDGQWNNTSLFGKVNLTDPVSVKNISVSSNITVRPNYIQFANTSDVNVYDVTGKLVLKASRVNQISTSALRSGVYVVSAGNESKKFIR